MNRAFNDYLRKLNVDPKNARKAQVPYDKGTVNFFVLDAGATNGELISALPQPVRQQQRHFQRQADAVSGGDPRSRVHPGQGAGRRRL